MRPAPKTTPAPVPGAPLVGAAPFPMAPNRRKTLVPAWPAEFIEQRARYLDALRAERRSPLTLRAAKSDLSGLFKFLAVREVERLADVTPALLNDYSLWLREVPNARNPEKKLAMTQIAHCLGGAKRFFAWLAKTMHLLADPAEGLEPPKLPSTLPAGILTQAEMRRFLDAPDLRSPVGYRDKALLELLYATGARTMELLRLKVQDLDFVQRTVFIREGKGGKDRLIPVPALAMGYAREYVEKVRPRFARATRKGDDGTLFLSYTGYPVTKDRIAADIFKKTLRAAGIDKRVTPLTIRHTLGSHLLENGMDIRSIQEMLGHQRMQTTTIYTKVTLTGLRRHYNKHHPREQRARRLPE